jgi:hypothetical protein
MTERAGGSHFGLVAWVDLPNRNPVHIQNSENLQVFHRLPVAASDQITRKMEGRMTKDLINTALLTLAVCLGMAACSGIFVSAARSKGLETAIAVCRGNPKCTYGALDSDGGLMFKLEIDGALKMLRCSGAGECMRAMPRGQKYSVSDVESVLKAR